MKSGISNGLFLFFMLYFMSCTPIYKTMVVDKYTKGKIPGAALVIASFINEPYVSYLGDVTEEFGEGNENELIIKHFKEALVENLRQMSTFSTIRYADYETRPILDTVVFDPEDMRKFRMVLPKESTKLSFKNAKAHFVLFIQDLTLGIRLTREPGYMGGRGIGIGIGAGVGPSMYVGRPASKKNLRYEGKFAIWDNINGRAAVYGRIKAETQSKFFNIIEIEQWREVDRRFARDLLYGTPFVR